MLTSSVLTSTRAMTGPRRVVETSVDSCILALASELEAAATPYLADDSANDAIPRDPGYEADMAHSQALYDAVVKAAERIFAHEPQTLPGLLVIAHAAALTADNSWEEGAVDAENDGRLLRLLANGLFRLAGVDWRGRPLIDVEQQGLALTPTPIQALDEAGLLSALDAHREAELSYNKAAKGADRIAVARAGGDISRRGMAPREAACSAAQARCVEAWNGIFDIRPRTRHGMLAFLRHMREHEDSIDEEDVGQVLRHVEAALEGICFATAPAPAPETPTFSPDAALIPLAEAAIAEERAATAISEATHHDTPPGTFARSMQLLELVAATDARTPAGVAAKARLLLTHAPEEDDLDGDWRCQALALSLARDATRLGASIPAQARP